MLGELKSTGTSIHPNAWARIGLLACLLLSGCGRHANTPVIEFTQVPPAGEGGPDRLDGIEGRVRGATPDERIVLYAKAGSIWWIQPLAFQPFTSIASDSTWKTATHLGTQYAAILVDAGYEPALTLKTLPPKGNGVFAVATASVGAGPAIVNRTLKFSGYEWYVRHVTSDRNGAISYYAPANAWTDPDGALHLKISRDGDRWMCSQVALTNHFGYGTYLFQVKDSSRFEPAVTLAMFTYDDLATDHHREMDIEMSRWGDPKNKNGGYVVQPYFFPENKVTFEVPAGPLTHSLHWQAGKATFDTTRGTAKDNHAPVVEKNVFATGIPSPGGEAIVIDFCNFKYSKRPLQNGAEAVIEKFQYLP
jgi:hypothetical protein